jgi:lysine 6-dehydrogenase
VGGVVDGVPATLTLVTTHPPSDGSVAGWKRLRAYTRNVGTPLAIGAILLTEGQVAKTGVIAPEEAFAPEQVFAQLARRGIETVQV